MGIRSGWTELKERSAKNKKRRVLSDMDYYGTHDHTVLVSYELQASGRHLLTRACVRLRLALYNIYIYEVLA